MSIKRFPAIPEPGDDLESLASAVRALRDAVNILTGATRDQESRAVLVADVPKSQRTSTDNLFPGDA